MHSIIICFCLLFTYRRNSQSCLTFDFIVAKNFYREYIIEVRLFLIVYHYDKREIFISKLDVFKALTFLSVIHFYNYVDVIFYTVIDPNR